MRTRPGCCPRCGERVTPFAAGCAFCGADLDPRRHQPPRWTPASLRVSSSMLLLTGLFALLTVFEPLLALLLCAWIGYDREQRGPRSERNLAIGFGVLAFMCLVSPATRFGLLSHLGLA